ncbi:MAG: NADH-quinone oxidoreductase subunit [Fimbriimonadaceae bacterium]|nr:NADH-quinone oxidoreductase subunit [Fimbriimonadaceae bacterium]
MLAPIAIVAVAGMIALLIETIVPKRSNKGQWLVSILGLAFAGLMLTKQVGSPEGDTLNGLLIADRFGLIAQLVIVAAAFICILFSEDYLVQKRIAFGEFYPLALWSTVGGMVMVSTHNLLVIFVGLEILSIALYVLAGMSRSEERSEESAMKYFLLGAFASAFLLYGIAFIYGATGGLDMRLANTAWASGDVNARTMLIFGGALILVGLGFKSSLVPFHQWTPDVYQGAPTNVAAFMASVSKVAALATLWRVLDDSRALAGFYLPVLFWLAILTMTIGNLAALVQKDVKRILGYSSISHAGYVLVGIAANIKSPNTTNVATVLYYLLAYTLMTVGSFAIVSLVAKGGRESTSIEDLHGLSRRAPLAAGILIVFMISLIGMPPTAGFIGKWMIFNDALNADLAPLAIVLAINSAISIYYYVGIVRAAYVVEEGYIDTAPIGPALVGATILCLVGVIMASFFVTPFMGYVSR